MQSESHEFIDSMSSRHAYPTSQEGPRSCRESCLYTTSNGFHRVPESKDTMNSTASRYHTTITSKRAHGHWNFKMKAQSTKTTFFCNCVLIFLTKNHWVSQIVIPIRQTQIINGPLIICGKSALESILQMLKNANPYTPELLSSFSTFHTSPSSRLYLEPWQMRFIVVITCYLYE